MSRKAKAAQNKQTAEDSKVPPPRQRAVPIRASELLDGHPVVAAAADATDAQDNPGEEVIDA